MFKLWPSSCTSFDCSCWDARSAGAVAPPYQHCLCMHLGEQVRCKVLRPVSASMHIQVMPVAIPDTLQIPCFRGWQICCLGSDMLGANHEMVIECGIMLDLR